MTDFAKAGGAAMTSNRDDWETPQEVFDELDRRFLFTLDPCSTDANAKCAKHFTREDDGLAQSWMGETAFVNPPYGRDISKWVEKCRRERDEHGTVSVMLIPARTDTSWFHDHIYGVADIEFIRGRLKFTLGGVSVGAAPFPSMVVIYD